AALALLVGCGVHRGEAVGRTLDHIATAAGRSSTVRGKHGRVTYRPSSNWPSISGRTLPDHRPTPAPAPQAPRPDHRLFPFSAAVLAAVLVYDNHDNQLSFEISPTSAVSAPNSAAPLEVNWSNSSSCSVTPPLPPPNGI